jgi:hypothetical protein
MCVVQYICVTNIIQIMCVTIVLYYMYVPPSMCETGPQLGDMVFVHGLGISVPVSTNRNVHHLLYNHQVSIVPNNVYCKLFVSLTYRVFVLYNSHFKIEIFNFFLENYLCMFAVLYECNHFGFSHWSHRNPRQCNMCVCVCTGMLSVIKATFYYTPSSKKNSFQLRVYF